jgi:NADH dehydrogenase
MPESLADYAYANLEKRGIEIQLGVGVSKATGTQLVTSENEVIDTRTIVATIGNTPSAIVANMPLGLQNGRVLVGRDFKVEGQDNIWAIGDCALIPLTENATKREDFAPPTAQFAVREAAHLSLNIKNVIEKKNTMPFKYKSKGALASLGAGRGVAEVLGLKLTGRVAWLLWRVYYISLLPGAQARVSVLWNWLMDGVSRRSVAQINSQNDSGTRYVCYRAGDRIYENGSRADGLYTIVSGSIRITSTNDETGSEENRILRKGEHFGELILLGATRRIATAVAVEDAKVLVVTRQEFLKLAEGLPFFNNYFSEHLKASGLGDKIVLTK